MIGGVTQTDKSTIDEQADGKVLHLDLCHNDSFLNLGINEGVSDSIKEDNNTVSGKFIIEYRKVMYILIYCIYS